jgi:hypothetical protein
VETITTRLQANDSGAMVAVDDVVLTADATSDMNKQNTQTVIQGQVSLSGVAPTNWLAGQKVIISLQPQGQGRC